MTEDSAAYRSQLIIYGDQPLDLPAAIKEGAIFQQGPPPADLERPGDVTDATDTDLASLCVKAVVPVVASLLRKDELEDLHLAWGAPPHERDVWVHLLARGEVFEDLLDSPNYEDGGDLDAVTVAARLADHLQDWLCETAFAWGELRAADYTLPTP
ncbi:hypothetical protein [Allobranchiibius sp. GilTou38]|uniref:hypothetical protein n=1 Tax=Allobranchiibius sp. GilTou38 TaxID=2815210 RepID=UPI001AA0E37A|nr:hypothetical protein [Allobranchiibius sp. GilTou38]MBO1766446.1 hypothetical protein [Allobranchiibius sp. GilTou38]